MGLQIVPTTRTSTEIEPAAEALKRFTSEYWRLSSIMNGRHPDNITTGEAIACCNELTLHLGPHRRLQSLTTSLSQAIVNGRRRRKPKDFPDNVRVLHGKAS